MYKYRYLQDFLIEKNVSFGAILLTEPRRAGKSTLVKMLLKQWGYEEKNRYISFDTPDIVARFQNDPVLFMQNLEYPCILDEIQNAPEVFKYIKADIDRHFQKKIRFILSGIQPLSFSPVYGFGGVLVIPALADTPVLASAVLGAVLAAEVIDWSAFQKLSQMLHDMKDREVQKKIAEGIQALNKIHDKLEKPLREKGIIDKKTK